MVKTRMSVLDLNVQARELKHRLVGGRVVNIYDINTRTYVLKFTVPPARNRSKDAGQSREDDQITQDQDQSSLHQMESPVSMLSKEPETEASSGDGWQKLLLLIESGARIHVTEFERDHGAVPSGFCLKLRKHIRMHRLEDIQQLGSDRVFMLTFSRGRSTVTHLIIEFYAGGNIILTDHEYTVLSLLRVSRPRAQSSASESRVAAQLGADADAQADHQSDFVAAEHVLGVRDKYPVESVRPAQTISLEMVKSSIATALKNLPDEKALAACSTRAARRKLKSGMEVKTSLASVMSIGPQIVEHALVRCGLPGDLQLPSMTNDPDFVEGFYACLSDITNMFNLGDREDESCNCRPAALAVKGYVFLQQKRSTEGLVTVMDDFAPVKLAQFADRPCIEFDSFDVAVDKYFSQLEMERAEISKTKREAAAYKKVDKLASELHGQVSAFELTQSQSVRKAQAIESNIKEVDAAITVINSALAATVDWDDLARMVEHEKKNGNSVAEIIHSFHLENNTVTLMLEDSWEADNTADENVETNEDDNQNDDVSDDEDEEDGERLRSSTGLKQSAATRKVLLVDVDLGLTAYANACEYYALKKSSAAKMKTAVTASERTITAASKRAATEAKKLEAEAAANSIRARRKSQWFEKFHWMISSENYLVVAGRDAQQNEMLVKRYMGPADAYVHADIHGASSVIVKNRKPPGASSYVDIPQLTLEQAGSLAMCRSAAWDAKIVTSAWWVRASQVSKSPPSGLSLATGSFVIRGKKNFLNPSQLVMGFAILFKVDESCAGKHRHERGVRTSEGLDVSPKSRTVHALGDASMAELSEAVEVNVPARTSEDSDEPDGRNEQQEDEDEEDDDELDIVGDEVNQDSEEQGSKGHEQFHRSTTVLPESNAERITEQVNEGAEAISESVKPVSGLSSSVENSLYHASTQVDAVVVRDGRRESESDNLQGDILSEAPDSLPQASSDEIDTSQGRHQSKRRISAKERRNLRRLKNKPDRDINHGDAQLNKKDPLQEAVKEDKVCVDGDNNVKLARSKQIPLPRGKRSKVKRMKKKYADQDEEERELALVVLGSKKVTEHGPVEKEDSLSGPPLEDRSEAGVSESPDQRGTAKATRSRIDRQEKKEVMRSMEQEGIEELSALEQESLNILDLLTASPFPDDAIEYALPLCAPYSALTNYRYRAKLLPGSLKRGKAYRASLAVFLRQAEKNMQLYLHERDAMRLIPENDAMHMMMGNVRVMAPGLAEAQKSIQKKKAGLSKTKA